MKKKKSGEGAPSRSNKNIGAAKIMRLLYQIKKEDIMVKKILVLLFMYFFAVFK